MRPYVSSQSKENDLTADPLKRFRHEDRRRARAEAIQAAVAHRRRFFQRTEVSGCGEPGIDDAVPAPAHGQMGQVESQRFPVSIEHEMQPFVALLVAQGKGQAIRVRIEVGFAQFQPVPEDVGIVRLLAGAEEAFVAKNFSVLHEVD